MGWPTWACGPGQLPVPTKPRKPRSAGQLRPSSGSATMRPDPPAYSRLAQIQVPGVVIVGDQEYPIVARCAADIAARLTGSQQIAAPGADHLLPLRVPTMIAELAGNLAG